jgi:hypothetical protein
MLEKIMFFFVLLFLLFLGIATTFPSGGGVNENTLAASGFLILAGGCLIISLTLALFVIIKFFSKK